MHGLYSGDHVYWLITFGPRYKHHCRKLEHAIKKGVHFRMLILKDCQISELCAREIIGYSEEEFRGDNRLFLASLQDIAGRINERDKGSLGVFMYDALPNIPLFIILRHNAKIVEVYNSYYLSEPVGRMPYYTGSLSSNAITVTPSSRKNGTCPTFFWTTFKGVGQQKEVNCNRPIQRIQLIKTFCMRRHQPEKSAPASFVN